jgi:O-antigen/teichoic acid export membrane protein
MGIVAKQSIYNLISICFAFLIGGANMLFLYPSFPGKEFQGLIVALLANSNLVQPFISFGVQHTLIKFFSDSKEKEERDRLMWFVLLFPLIIMLFLAPIYFNYDIEILRFLSNNNEGVERFPFLIIAIAISTAYFEIFFSWLRVNLKSVFGNFLKEVYPRMLTFILLISFAFQILNLDQFINFLIGGYYLRLLIVMVYSFYVYTPSFQLKLPKKYIPMLRYSSLIFLSGAAASFILDIDKSMIYSLTSDVNVAFYAVAIYIAAVIEAPGRAMFQITSPLVAEALNSKNKVRLESLLKKSSINLMIVSGLLFLIINLNLEDFYNIINQQGYESAIGVVVIVSLGKLFSMSMGCLNNIISNSKHYSYVFWFSISSAILAVFLNYIFIKEDGILGAAFATLIVIIFINSCKILLVNYLFKIHPYSSKTLSVLLIISLIYILIYSLPSIFNPWLSILLRSLLIIGLFCIPLFRFSLSKEIETLFEKFIKRLF